MKSILLSCLLCMTSVFSFSQSPSYYYYDPPNAGVNNLYFNDVISYKFLFIITQSEWASVGVAGPVLITSIWLKSNTAYSLFIDDLKITMGHSTLAVPVSTFANNFDVGSPVQVLNEASYNYVMIGAPWNDPPSGWTEIPLTTPFLYNATDNMVLQFEYSHINYPIPIYANNGGIPIAQLSSVFDSTIADSYTARPMVGISGAQSPVAFGATDSSVCEKFCINFFDFSSNNPTSWFWDFPGGVPSSSTDQDPSQICYDNPGVYDVSLITTNTNGSDTLFLPGFITVYPTPSIPSITINGNTLTSSPASSYQWQLNFTDIPGATNQSYTATLSGAYTVIISDSTGCTALNTIDFTLTGEEELSTSAEIRIFPNPSDGTFLIDVHASPVSGALSIYIRSAMGNVVFSGKESGPSMNEINLNAFPSGIYTIEILDGASILMRKKIIIDQE